MYTTQHRIRLIFTSALVICLCASTTGAEVHSETTQINLRHAQLENLSQAALTLRVLLTSHNVLPIADKNSNELAKEILGMLKDKLNLRVDEDAEDMDDLELVQLMRRKFGSSRDLTLLFAAFLLTCRTDVKLPTAVTSVDGAWLLLFKTDTMTQSTVQWENQMWTVIAIPSDQLLEFSEAQKRGKVFYEQFIQTHPTVNPVRVSDYWKWDFNETKETLVHSGITHGQKKQLQKAEDCFKNALQIDTQSAAAINNLGNVALLRGQIDEAIQKYKQAQQLDKDDYAIFLNLGVAYHQKWKKSSEDAKPKRHLKKQYETAFDRAYRGIGNGLNLCRFLDIDPEKEADREYCELVHESEKRVADKKPKWRPLGGRGEQPKIPVYWKNF
jgi:tetratricopeptide (TPR) repeat protein